MGAYATHHAMRRRVRTNVLSIRPLRRTRPDGFFFSLFQYESESSPATPRLIQWFCGRSLGIVRLITKLLECPVVAKTPRRSAVR